MRPWPFTKEQLSWRSPLRPDDFRSRFWAQVHPSGMPLPDEPPMFSGVIRDQAVAEIWEFHLKKTASGNSAIDPDVMGTVRQAQQGTEFEVSIQLPWSQRATPLVWTGFATAFAIIGGIGHSVLGVLAPVAMVTVAYLVGSRSYRSEVRRVRSVLGEISAAKPPELEDE